MHGGGLAYQVEPSRAKSSQDDASFIVAASVGSQWGCNSTDQQAWSYQRAGKRAGTKLILLDFLTGADNKRVSPLHAPRSTLVACCSLHTSAGCYVTLFLCPLELIYKFCRRSTLTRPAFCVAHDPLYWPPKRLDPARHPW